MKKVLVSIFGGILLTASSALVTGQNVDTAVKVEKNKKIENEEIINALQSLNSQNNFSAAEIKAWQATAQNWDNQSIDDFLNQALHFDGKQLIIDQQQLNVNKLPVILVQNLDLVVGNLNNAVAFGLIKVELTGHNVKLVYSENSSSSTDEEIVYFKGETSLNTFSSYMWYTTYGPSRWWKFWEWGGYVHFSENAVQVANVISDVLNWVSLAFLFTNISKISNVVNKIKYAKTVGDVQGVIKATDELSKILGGISLDLLGEVSDIIAIFTGVIGVLTAASGIPIIVAILALSVAIVQSVLSTMLRVDLGKGVKWQWYNFIIPAGISAE